MKTQVERESIIICLYLIADQTKVNVPDTLHDPNIRLASNIDEEAIIDKLKEDIKEEEDIAMKSALLLQLLEVGLYSI